MRFLAPVAVLAATGLTYAVTLNYGFVFDDHVLVATNEAIRSWHYLPSYFTSHIWSFSYPHLLANYYRPFFLIWLRLNDMVFGLRPWGWHLTSVLAHAGVTCLVYFLTLRLTQDRVVACLAGLLFGLHPVQAEAVSDITSAQELLSTLFAIAAFLAWLRSREQREHVGWLAGGLCLFAGALLSKESGLVLPLTIAAFEWLAEGSEDLTLPSRLRRIFVSIAPFLAVTAVYLAIRIWSLKGLVHTVTPLPLSTEVLTIPSVLLFYVRMMVWPHGLSCYYDTPYVSATSLRTFVLPFAGILGIVVCLAWWYARLQKDSPALARVMAFAALWMGLAIAPVLNFCLLPEGEIAHDRYLYLPLVGFALLVALGLRHAGARIACYFRRPRVWGLAAAGLLAVVMASASARQSLYWADDLSLNHRAHEIAPHNVSATTSLAAAAAQRGMEGAAVALYHEALAKRPDFWRANVNLAYFYYAHGNYPEAARYFQRACTSDPTDGDQFLYLGMSLLRMGQASEAEKAVRTALLVRPNGKKYHLGLGMVLNEEAKYLEAQQEFEKELANDPQSGQAEALLEEAARRIRGPNGERLP